MQRLQLAPLEFDEQWSFVKKQHRCTPGEPGVGDIWEHVALDLQTRRVEVSTGPTRRPVETKLVVALAVGQRHIVA